jgi:hypothetical protein
MLQDYYNDFNDMGVINVDVCYGFCPIKLNAMFGLAELFG